VILRNKLCQDQGRIKWTRSPGQSLDREAPKRLAQLRSISHALVSTLQKHRSKTSKLIENAKLAVKFRLINLNVSMTLYLPSWHRHCTRTRFTVVVSCNDLIAVRSRPRLCPHRQVAELASGLLNCCGKKSSNVHFKLGSRRFFACDQGSLCVFFHPELIF